MKDLFLQARQTVKHWWLSIVIGILTAGIGIWVMFIPVQTFIALSLFFVIALLFEGIMEVAFSLSNRKRLHGWGWNFTMGIIDIIFAVFLLINPMIIPVIFGYAIAFWLLLRAAWGISASLDLKHYGLSGWGWFMGLSVAGVLLSVGLLIFPLMAASFTAYVVGASLILYGIFRILLGVRLRSIQRFAHEIDRSWDV